MSKAPVAPASPSWVTYPVPSHTNGSPERARFLGQGVPWWEQKTNPNAAIRDYLRVCPVLDPTLLGVIFGGLVTTAHLQAALKVGALAKKKWRGKTVFWLKGHSGVAVGDYPTWGWDPLLGPLALNKVAEDMMGRRGFQTATTYLGWDAVDWMYEFMEPKGIPHHWSNEQGNGAGLVYGQDQKGNHEVVVVLPAREQQVEASFRSLFRDLTELLAYIHMGLEGAKLTLRIIWLMPSYTTCPGHRIVAPARKELYRLWSEPKVVRFWREDRTVVLDSIRLAETGFLVPAETPGLWRQYDIIPGSKSVQVPHGPSDKYPVRGGR